MKTILRHPDSLKKQEAVQNGNKLISFQSEPKDDTQYTESDLGALPAVTECTQSPAGLKDALPPIKACMSLCTQVRDRMKVNDDVGEEDHLVAVTRIAKFLPKSKSTVSHRIFSPRLVCNDIPRSDWDCFKWDIR